MGSLPRLKKKDELKYRKGHRDEGLNCEYCINYIKIIDKPEGRCKIMGMNSSRRYRVLPSNTCNAQERDDSRCWWIEKRADVGGKEE